MIVDNVSIPRLVSQDSAMSFVGTRGLLDDNQFVSDQLRNVTMKFPKCHLGRRLRNN